MLVPSQLRISGDRSCSDRTAYNREPQVHIKILVVREAKVTNFIKDKS
jgi:hypothetical protein